MHNKHFELHVALNAEDLDLYARGGLPEVPVEPQSCANCGTDIADNGKKFIPLAIVLDGEHDHLLCLSCAAPVIGPKS